MLQQLDDKYLHRLIESSPDIIVAVDRQGTIIYYNDGARTNLHFVPGEIIGPWFLWKLLIDERYQGRGYGRAALRQVVEIVRNAGATELLTSYVTGEGEPWPFYERFGFVPTGERDSAGEVILSLDLAWASVRESRFGCVTPLSRNQAQTDGARASPNG